MFGNRLLLTVFAVMISATSLWQAEAAQAQETYASIAYSKQSGCWGFAYGVSTRSQAEQQAVSKANCSHARSVVWVKNGYVALALGKDPSACGWAWAATAEQAKLMALREASRQTTNCYIAVCVNSRTGRE